MLVHICCSVDSHFFLQELRKEYPKERLVGFFYDPNIHPYSEYQLRLLDVERSCDKLGIELIEGEYDYENWIESVNGLENEPEKGKRCVVCFDNRLERTAQKAKELHVKTITTTLLTSPKKSLEQLKSSLEMVEKDYNVKVLTPDFRKNGGTSRQFELAKKDKLYHQNYCGCLYALVKQREGQKRLTDELMSPMDNRTLPQSIEERIGLYEKVIKCEDEGVEFELRRQKFLNYRLLRASVATKDEVLPSFILFYSHMKRFRTQGRVESEVDGVGYFNRESIILLSLETYNLLNESNYESVKELMFNPPSVKEDLHVRKMLQGEFYSLSPIIVLDAIVKDKLTITMDSYIYDDVRELLALKG